MSADMYPERRPYATTVPHSGYLAKPFLPPVEALRILNSTIGIDTPASMRRDLASLDAVRLPSRPSSRPPSRPRTRPAESIGLATPFAFKDKDYHTSQQVALNAQLHNAIEELFKVWHHKIRDLQSHLRTYPPQSATSNKLTADATDSYFDGYRATDVLPLPAEDLAQDFNLATNPAMLDGIQRAPALAAERIRRTLDTLLNSNHFLAPLEHYVEELEALASIALPDEPRDVQTMPGEEADRAQVYITRLNRAAVALHEKFHYDPSEYAMRELRKSDAPIDRLERHVLEEKELKERAMDEAMPGDALTHLIKQVDLSNDLLLMNKARLELVHLHSKDVRELRPLVETVIEDARRSSLLLRSRVDGDLPVVQKDLDGLRKDIENTEEHLQCLAKANREANQAARKGLRVLDDKERDVWDLLLRTMQQLVKSAEERDAFVQREMRLREQRAHDEALANELLTTQRNYCDRLRACEETLWRWGNAAQVFEAYVEAFAPKLLKKVHDAEEADQDLYNRESQDYVRRYEMFEYAVEEARATRQVYTDRMRLTQRARQLDVERAADTLDPNRNRYDKDLDGAQAQLEETRAYMDYIHDLERDRRAEVEPILQQVLTFNRTAQSRLSEMETTAALQLEAKPPVLPSAQTDTAAETPEGAVVPHAASTKSSGLWLKTADTHTSQMMATVAHPHIQARTVGIHHEENFLEKLHRFTDGEQNAVEDCAGKVRKFKHDLDKYGMKYNNMDYVRMTLGRDPNSTD